MPAFAGMTLNEKAPGFESGAISFAMSPRTLFRGHHTYYKQCARKSSSLRVLRYAGGTSRTVLQPV